MNASRACISPEDPVDFPADPVNRCSTWVRVAGMTAKKANELNMQNRKTYREQRRICMPSGRNFCRETFLCGHYEAQDVFVEVDDVDLVCLEPGRGHKFKERWQVRLMYRYFSGRGVFAKFGLNKVRLTREYDRFLARCQTEKDLPHINAIEGWQDHCKSSVCRIDELWAAAIPLAKYWLHALRRFDHIFTSCLGTVGPLSQAIERPIHFPVGLMRFDSLRILTHERVRLTFTALGEGSKEFTSSSFRRPGAEKYSTSTTHLKAPWRTFTTIGSIVITSRMSHSEADTLWWHPERSMRLKKIKANLKWDIAIVRDLPLAQCCLDKRRMVKHSGECFLGKTRSYKLNLMGVT